MRPAQSGLISALPQTLVCLRAQVCFSFHLCSQSPVVISLPLVGQYLLYPGGELSFARLALQEAEAQGGSVRVPVFYGGALR